MTIRNAWVMKLKPGNEALYKQRHDDIWPEMLALMQKSGARNFSIYRDGLLLFAYQELDRTPELGAAVDPIVWRWWKMMAPLMETNADFSRLRNRLKRCFTPTDRQIMTTKKLEGVIPILVTPFDEQGRIDVDSLQQLIDFNIAAGVHGLGVALGSEIFKLNEAERDLIASVVVKHAAGRVPVIINTGASGTDLAVQYSRAAERAGADALMVIPPHFMPVSAAEIGHYYRTIDAAVGVSLILQDIPQAPVPPGMAVRLQAECRNVTAIKVETLPITSKVADMVQAAGDILTVLGGAGGGYFIEEMRRGARGTMPFCSQPAPFVETWNLFQAGDHAGARRVFDANIMAVNRLASQGGDLFYHLHKQILVRRGVIRTAIVRSPTIAIDAISQREIDELLDQLVPA